MKKVRKTWDDCQLILHAAVIFCALHVIEINFLWTSILPVPYNMHCSFIWKHSRLFMPLVLCEYGHPHQKHRSFCSRFSFVRALRIQHPKGKQHPVIGKHLLNGRLLNDSFGVEFIHRLSALYPGSVHVTSKTKRTAAMENLSGWHSLLKGTFTRVG